MSGLYRPSGELELDHFSEFIARRFYSAEDQPWVERFVAEELALGEAEVSIGQSSTRNDGQTSYLILHQRGPRRFGGIRLPTAGERAGEVASTVRRG